MKQLLTLLGCLFFGMLHAQNWHENFEDALATANAEDKPIVLVFSGSDWCAPCIKLKRSILDSEDFQQYASSHYVLYNADFPRKKKNQLPSDKSKANKALFVEYNPKGYFPLVVVLNKQKSVLGVTGFNKSTTPQEYISVLNGYVK